jgi:hypothetical protein
MKGLPMTGLKRCMSRGRIFVLLAVVSALSLDCAAGGRGAHRGFEIEKVYGRGAAVEFAVRVSKAKISTAETVELLLEIKAAEDWNVDFPEVPDTLGEFKVVERAGEERRLDRDRNLISTRRYTLEPFLPARYTIPPLEVRFGTGGGYAFSVRSDEVVVEVTSVLPPQLGEQDIEEIAGPLALGSRKMLWYGLGAGAVLAAAAAAGVVILRRRRRRHVETVKVSPPWEAARQELEDLLELGLIEAGRFKEFYEGISNLTRRYIERRFEIRAPELTTEEFLVQAQASAALVDQREALRRFLAHCDLVKFARYEPSPEEVRLAVSSCRDFLAATTPKAAHA